MICIVSGPTCSGKSTLLASPRLAALSGLSRDSSIAFPDSIPSGLEALEGDFFFHYNTLRCASSAARREAPGSSFDFATDSKWFDLLALPCAKRAIVLTVSRDTLLRRLRHRTHFEPDPRGRHAGAHYSRSHWARVLARVDLGQLQRSWCSSLEKNGIEFDLVDGTDGSFPICEPAGRHS